jgi:hypothetical protein
VPCGDGGGGGDDGNSREETASTITISRVKHTTFTHKSYLSVAVPVIM